MTDWRTAHRERVARLEAEATAVMLGALAPILADVAGRFAAVQGVTASAEDQAQLDDLAAINTQWGYAVDDVVLPWFGGMFEAGAEAAEEQVAAIRGAGVVIPAPDPELMSYAASQYLADVRNRFYPLGETAWSEVRAEMLAGFRAGEGVDDLRRRITSVTDVTVREAETIARTEVISASNMGAQARIDLMGDDAPPYRQWLATMDRRTRPTHVRADGQVQPKGTPFLVGGASLMVPGDPSGPGAEVINCRCTVLYTDQPEPMEIPGRGQGGEPIPGGVVDEVALAASATAEVGPRQVDSVTGEEHTGAMVALVPADPEAWTVPGGEPADAVHLTLQYLGDSADIPTPVFDNLVAGIERWAEETPPVDANVFGAAVWNTTGDEPCMVLSVGGDLLPMVRDEVATIVGRAGVSAGPSNVWQPPAQHTPWVAHVCVAYADPALLNPGPTAAAMEGPIVFDRVRVTLGGEAQDFPLAGTPPEEEDDAMNRADVSAQLTAAVEAAMVRAGGGPLHLTINLAAGDDAPPSGLPAPPAMPDEADVDDGPPAQPGEHLRAVMHVQGESTGLNGSGRVFTNLTYRDTPFAYHWQQHSSAHGGTPKTIPVGLVTRVVEVGDTHYGFITLDLDNPDAYEHGRRAVAGFDRWVSIGADETLATTTLVWPPMGEDADPMGLAVPEPVDPDEEIEETILQPLRVIIDGANVAELSGVSFPAQDAAVLEPTEELVSIMGGAPTVPAADQAVTAAGGWCAPAELLPYDPAATPPADDGHDCGCGGSCGGCGDDADVEAMVAAARTITVRELPPERWFQEPTDVDIDGAFCVTDAGRIYGLLAPYGTNHRAFAVAGRRQEVPAGNVDYDRYMGAWALTAEGRCHAGPITMDCGHAPIHRADHNVGREHYDNSCSIFGQAAVGESRQLGGVWIAGAVLPGTPVERIARALACRLSGDWQPHADRAGWTELVATLLVPSPGFASQHPTTSYRADALVASSVPVRHIATSAEADARRRAATVAHLVGRPPADRVLSNLGRS